MIALYRWWILKDPDSEGKNKDALMHGPVLAFMATAWYCEIKSQKTMMALTQIYKGKLYSAQKYAKAFEENEPSSYRLSDEVEIAAYLL